jgi:hypothetical protein
VAWVARLGTCSLKFVKYVNASRHSLSMLGSEFGASDIRRANVPITAEQ